jgi:hypothetical protein
MSNQKEKAKELVEKFMPFISGADRYNTTLGIYDTEISKQCALIAVDELIKSSPQKPRSYTDTMLYWEEVKQEISNI